jgi:hypothetical protein
VFDSVEGWLEFCDWHLTAVAVELENPNRILDSSALW